MRTGPFCPQASHSHQPPALQGSPTARDHQADHTCGPHTGPKGGSPQGQALTTRTFDSGPLPTPLTNGGLHPRRGQRRKAQDGETARLSGREPFLGELPNPPGSAPSLQTPPRHGVPGRPCVLAAASPPPEGPLSPGPAPPHPPPATRHPHQEAAGSFLLRLLCEGGSQHWPQALLLLEGRDAGLPGTQRRVLGPRQRAS